MHTDEAVHADNFQRTFLAGNPYEYDPHEYHGPTLNFFTLIPARLSGANTYPQLTEGILRIVPVVFGTILVLLSLLLVRGLGPAALPAAALAALSPALIFYSRYYIQEMLLVCFTFGVIACGYRYSRTRALPWAIATGVFAGLMHATKETCIIAFGALGLALIVLQRGRLVRALGRPLPLILGVAAALGVSALFYSSFLRHPRGVLDSYLTYATYLSRGVGENTVHVQPWHYYLQMLVFARYFDGPVWTEGWIVLLALVGMLAAVKGDRLGLFDPRLVRFLALYTASMTAAYSAIPYKTPWCLLGFLHGMILLAGVGAATLLAWAKGRARIAIAVLLPVVAGHLAFQAYRANFVYEADSRNPYVYAHPTREVFTIAEKVREYVGIRGLGQSEATPVQVAVDGNDYWPLPWYLRGLEVEWRSDVSADIQPLILISGKLEEALTHRIYVDTPPGRRQMYLYLFDAPYYLWFRPGIKMIGFIRGDFWEEHASRQLDPTEFLEGRRGQDNSAPGDPVRRQ